MAVLGEVGKDGGAGPDSADVDGAVGIFDEVIAGDAGVVRGVACVGQIGDVEVGDGDDVEVFSASGRATMLGKLGKVAGSTVKGRLLSW